MRPTRRAQAGFSLLEVMIAVSVLAVGILAVFGLNLGALEQVSQSRQRSIARLAAIRAREALETHRFRKLTPTSTYYFLYGKQDSPVVSTSTFPIAYNADGSAFQMLDCTQTFGSSFTIAGAAGTATNANPYAATVDGVSGCVCVEFPVPPLKAPQGRVHPGRIVFFLSEVGQPAGIPTAAFPFPATPGLTFLDCDGDGAKATGDLRTQDFTTPHPFKLIPVSITVDWKPTNGRAGAGADFESHKTHFLLNYRGYD